MQDPMEMTPGAGESSMWYNLCLLTIGASAALYASGRKSLGIFVGLWPPTFAALGNRAEINDEITRLMEGRSVHRIGGGDVEPRVGVMPERERPEARPRA